MSQSVQPNREPEATPVGHSGVRVEIHERQAWAISGWLGVFVVIACGVGAYFLQQFGPVSLSRADRRGGGHLGLVDHCAARPDQGRAVLRPLRRHRAPSRPLVDPASCLTGGA